MLAGGFAIGEYWGGAGDFSSAWLPVSSVGFTTEGELSGWSSIASAGAAGAAGVAGGGEGCDEGAAGACLRVFLALGGAAATGGFSSRDSLAFADTAANRLA